MSFFFFHPLNLLHSLKKQKGLVKTYRVSNKAFMFLSTVRVEQQNACEFILLKNCKTKIQQQICIWLAM